MNIVSMGLRRSKRGLFIIGLSLPFACYADDAGEWYSRAGALEALYHSSARIDTAAGTIPGASAEVSNNTTGIIEIGYDITPSTFVMLMAGVPPRPRISGTGSAAAQGELGAVTYGPAVLTMGYRIPAGENFEPYVGLGPAYAIILRNHDAAISNLDVHNNFGFALQTGVEYALGRRLQIFADVKQLWLSVNANGSLDAVLPVAARVQLNPTLISVGVKVRVK
jgi:outer membrane protein